jgi:hypothetical protein
MKQILNLMLFLGCTSVFSQVGVNTTTPNAAFDVNSATQGVLVSRVALTSKTVAAPVVNPQGGALANGTLVFNTATTGTVPNNVSPGFYYWNATTSRWIAITSEANSQDWLLTGNAGTNPATNFLGTTDARDFTVRTNNLERMRVSVAGNVGIGTTVPSAQLHTTGSVQFAGAGTPAVGKSLVSNATGLATWQNPLASNTTSNPITASATQIAVPSINVQGAIGDLATAIQFTASNGWKLDGNANGIMRKFGTTNAFDIPFITNNVERMRVMSAGNVGIGTSNPTKKLTVENGAIRPALGNSQDAGISFPTDPGGGSSDEAFIRYYSESGENTKLMIGIDDNPDDDISFFQDGAERMNIYNGNVGIGTTTPTAQLHTTGSVQFAGAGTPGIGKSLVSNATGLATWQNPLASNTTSNPITASATQIAVPSTNVQGAISDLATAIQSSTSNGWKLDGNVNGSSRRFGTIDAFDIPFITSNAERMRISASGNVGIGTATPAYKLDLANGTFGFGTLNSRTETRDNAGLQGNSGAQSGFFETAAPTNFPTGASSWWHLIDSRHSNPTNNYALQIAGSFYDQDLYFRKTNGLPTTPWSKLLTSNSGWGTIGNTGTNPAANFLGTTDSRDLVVRTNNVERMRVMSNGNIGIGTAAANSPLQFSNNIQNRKLVLWEGTNNDHNFYGLGINNSILRYQVDGTTANHTFYAGTSATTSNELMRITGTGNVGIGVAAPVQRLDVQGGNARINNAFIGDVGYGSSLTGFAHYSQANTTGYGILQTSDGNYTFLNKQNTGGGYLGFRVGNTDQAVILNNGNMGVGTTNPSKKFTVVNGSIRPHVGNSGDAGIQFPTDPGGGGGGDEAFIRYYVDGGGEDTKLLIGNNNDANDDISFYQMGAQRLTLYNGNVGVGTGFPVALFQVYNAGTATSCFTDGINYYTSSDARLKTAISPLKNYGLNTIMQLKPITYTFKADQTNQPQVGFLAQEVQKIIPELVSGKEGDVAKGETLGVAYANLVPVLTKAIQEQQAMIEELKKKIEILEAKINK